MATVNYEMAQFGDGGVVMGCRVTFDYDNVTLKISKAYFTVAGLNTKCHFHIEDSATGFVFDQDYFPNPDGTTKTTVQNVPANAASFYTFITNPKGKQVFDVTSSGTTYFMSWPS